jgi:hypothetical protein
MSEKILKIPLLTNVKAETTLPDISRMLDKLNKETIGFVPWPKFPARPEVTFTIAHNNNAILLKYYVLEAETLARFKQPNDPVYRDSCVEFFIAFDNDGYYNLEFNSLGTCLGGYGKERGKSQVQPAALLRTIETYLQKTQNDGQLSAWSLTLEIPVSVFSFDPVTSLHGKKCRVNFYKCGDDLEKPQFLAWSNIEWPEPNFHLPQFFGEAVFL